MNSDYRYPRKYTREWWLVMLSAFDDGEDLINNNLRARITAHAGIIGSWARAERSIQLRHHREDVWHTFDQDDDRPAFLVADVYRLTPNACPTCGHVKEEK